MSRYARSTLFAISLGVALCLASFAHAQSRLSLTLTPPLFRLTLSPGEAWASSVKLVNANDYDLTVYARTMDFTDKNGRGTPEFIPAATEAGNAHSLGSWIEVADGPITVPAGSTKNIPFSVHVPPNAEPGGHYGAIQVGTVPVKEEGGSGVSIGSQVATLFFVRVSGAVNETASIRDFFAKEYFIGRSKEDFVLSVENTGNVHVQPQGEIVIKNMWGKVRGKVDINKESNFGNVLPNSSRTFEFAWDGADDSFDIGLYTAEVSVTYGEEGKQSLFRKTGFWIIPWKPVTTTLGSLLALIILAVWSVKRYIRQALELERRRRGLPSTESLQASPRIVAAPIGRGVRDLQRINKGRAESIGARPIGIGELLWRYRFVLVSLGAFLVIGYGVFAYFASVLTPSRDFTGELREIPEAAQAVPESE